MLSEGRPQCHLSTQGSHSKCSLESWKGFYLRAPSPVVGRRHDILCFGAFGRAASCEFAKVPSQIRLLTACEKSERDEAEVGERKQQSNCARADGRRTKVVQDQRSTPCSVAALRLQTQVGMNALCQEQNIATDANLFLFFWRAAYYTQVLWTRDSKLRHRNTNPSPVQCLV